MTDRVVYPTVCPGHTMGVWEIHYAATPEGLFFISACQDKLPMLRDGVTGDWIGTFEGHSGAVWSAKLNRSASVAITGSADSTAKLWNAISGELLHTFDHKRVVRTVDFAPDGSRIVTGGYEPVLRIFDTNNPSAAAITVDHPGGSRIKKAAWSQDGRSIFTGDEAGTVRLWDIASMRVVRETQVVRGVPEGVMDMELSGDGSMLTVAGGKVVSLLSTTDLTERVTHALPYDVEAASLHPGHGKYFIAGGADVRVRIHDSLTGAELFTQRGHHGRVHAVRFAPSGDTYVSGADDATIRLWRFDDTDLAPPPNQSLSSSSSSSPPISGAGATGAPQRQAADESTSGPQGTPIVSTGKDNTGFSKEASTTIDSPYAAESPHAVPGGHLGGSGSGGLYPGQGHMHPGYGQGQGYGMPGVHPGQMQGYPTGGGVGVPAGPHAHAHGAHTGLVFPAHMNGPVGAPVPVSAPPVSGYYPGIGPGGQVDQQGQGYYMQGYPPHYAAQGQAMPGLGQAGAPGGRGYMQQGSGPGGYPGYSQVQGQGQYPRPIGGGYQ